MFARTGAATPFLSPPYLAKLRALLARSTPGAERRPRIAFLFNAQRHQLLHGVTSAAALARDWDADVSILSPSTGHLAYARELATRYGTSPLRFAEIGWPRLNRLTARSGQTVPPKLLTLLLGAPALAGFDAIVLPERTSTIIRRFGVRRPKLIHIDHGAGDRAIGFDPRIRRFDFVMMAGEKHRRRMIAENLVSPGCYAVTGYPKFEAADLMRDPEERLFDTALPIVLYNPHFSSALGSWHKHGIEIIRGIAASGRYNLIVAPHVRLFDKPQARAKATQQLAEFEGMAHVHIDLGSERCVDMSYTALADIYLGDVSSQIYEYLRRPRPCLFVNAQRHDWRGDPNYAHWSFGPVIDDVTGIGAALDDAVASHDIFLAEQERGFADTFDLLAGTSSGARVAAAIGAFLRLQRAGATATTAATPARQG